MSDESTIGPWSDTDTITVTQKEWLRMNNDRDRLAGELAEAKASIKSCALDGRACWQVERDHLLALLRDVEAEMGTSMIGHSSRVRRDLYDRIWEVVQGEERNGR